MSFADRTSIAGHTIAVVGAGSGIGRTAAIQLATSGATVVCLDIDDQQAELTAETAREHGVPARWGAIDVADERSVVGAVSGDQERFGTWHALVNCAGITGTTGIKSHEVDADDFDRVCRVNLRGAFLLSRATIPGMTQRGYGRILHLASISGKDGNAGMVAYSASKAGVIGMVKSQGKEYAGSGVTINALAPAVVQTALVDAMPAEQVKYMTSRIPMGRTGLLDEVADMISFIVSPACSFVTGFTFDLSGGRAVY